MDISKLLSATSLCALLLAGCATDSTVSKPQHAEQQPSETKSASLTLLAPAEGAVVPTLSDGQKAYLALPRAERVKKFADEKYRPKMKALGYYPKPLTLSWTKAAPEKAATAHKVELFRATDGQCVFTTNFVSDAAYGSLLVDNLEIARPYEWRVTAGKASATGHFTTEDIAPRLIRLPGVPNVRDLGGRIGLDGRRVKQGIVYRSAGLNDNASNVYYTPEELEEKNPSLANRMKSLDGETAKWRTLESELKTNETAMTVLPVSLSENWTLFRPVINRAEFPTNAIQILENLASVPDEFLGAKGMACTLKSGETHTFDMNTAKGPAILMQEVDAPEDGYIAITAGGDYWWQIRSSGNIAFDLLEIGNWRSPYSPTNYHIPLPVRKGRNLIVTVLFTGSGGWSWGWTKYSGSPVSLAHDKVREHEKMKEIGGKVVKGRVRGRYRLHGAALDYALNTMGIKSDIDLRSDGECWGMTGSPLGDTVKWFHYSSGAYGGMQTEFGKAAFTNVFNVFLDERNYPIDFHCIAGQDRTGAVAFIINGLLGVEEEELYRDWESTGFWNPSPSFNHERLFNHLYSGFKQWPGKTINERIEAYVLSLGFTKKDIEHLRDIMLEEQPATQLPKAEASKQ